MAEVLGLVSSVITVAELAGRVATSAATLKRLWDEVKDVPEEVNALLEEIELLHPFLAEMENEFLQTPDIMKNLNAAKRALNYCRQAGSDLESLVEDMQQQIFTARGLKRKIAKVKVALKKDQIRDYKRRLRSILHLLSLSQQSYLIIYTRLQTSIIISELQASEARESEETGPQRPETLQHNTVLTDQAKSFVGSSSWISLKKIPWNRPNYLGSLSCQAFEAPSGIFTDFTTLYQARLQLPLWLAQKTWDLQVYNACDGWRIMLRPWNVRPFETEVFQHAIGGSASNLLMELNNNRASLYDRNPDGWTLLHCAALKGQLDIFQKLMRMGLEVNETDRFGATPLYYICRLSEEPDTALAFYRFLLSKDALDNALDGLFLPRYWHTKNSNLHRHIWSIPELLDLIADKLLPKFYHSQESWFSGIIWEYVNAKVLLRFVQHEDFISPAVFRSQLLGSFESSLHNLSKTYFENAASMLGNADLEAPESTSNSFESWRVLARWIFSGIQIPELSKTGKRPWEYATPLVFGLLSCSWGSLRSPSRPRRQISMALRMWLEDLLVSGTDLEDYGRCELSLFRSHGWLRTWRWSCLEIGGELPHTIATGPQLESFSFGPRPNDWVFIWDPAVEQFAGNFWEMIDDSPLPVPGGWVYYEDGE